MVQGNDGYQSHTTVVKFLGAATLLPPKKDDSGNVTDLRVVHDYRPHNDNTEQRAYLIPTPNELIVEIATFSIFSTMEIRGTYNNLPIKEESRCKTTFWGGDGLYEYNIALMGLKNFGIILA